MIVLRIGVLLCVVSVVLCTPNDVHPYHDALLHRNFAELQSLVSQKAPGINDLSEKGDAPLHVACLHGELESVRVLIEGGADATVVSTRWGTPLHAAAFQGRYEIVRFLIEKVGVSANLEYKGYTALHYACMGHEQRHAMTVHTLIELGVDHLTPAKKNSKTCRGLTSNHWTLDYLRTLSGFKEEL
eukprot:PhF_6_TR18596/c0_g1_i3/m.27170